MKTIKTIFVIFYLATIDFTYAQSFVTINIEEEYEYLTDQWLVISEDLTHYGGLSAFCTSEEYRIYTLDILNLLHHYDSVVLDLLKNPTSDIDVSSKEYRKTMSDIAKFEEEYDVKGFISFLKESCLSRRDLEKNKDDLKKEVGIYSYDGQVMMLETDLNKFMKHITKRIVAINDHVHKIHPSQVKSLQVVSGE